MVELDAQQKNFINTRLKPYLEKDDIKGVVDALRHAGFKTYMPSAGIFKFLYDLGIPLLENCGDTIPPGMFCSTDIDKIEIPPYITHVDDMAFYCCEHLTDVVFNEGLEIIGEYAFSWTKLQKIVFPESLKTVEAEAFSYCPNLSEIRLQSDVSIISAAFSGIDDALYIYVPEDIWEDVNSNWYHRGIFYNTRTLIKVVPY